MSIDGRVLRSDAASTADICRSVRSLCRYGPSSEAAAAAPGGPAPPRLPLEEHPTVLRRLRDQLVEEAPLSLVFSGQKNAYAILPPVLQNCPRAYTLTMWVKVDRWSKTSETILFRCHTSHSESIELLIASDDRMEGRCYCSIRVDAGSRVHNEAGGQLLMTPGRWHLLSFSHRCSPYPHPPKMAVRVDGELCLDRELDYPFGSAGVECTWTFGSGLAGAISSVALYPFEVLPRFVKFLADAGPACAALDCGVSNPQTSFDTGHCLVGTTFSRLEDYLDAGKSSPLFCFTAHHFLPGDGSDGSSGRAAQWIASHSPGYLTNGFIELANDCPAMNLTTVPTCMGSCGVSGPAGDHAHPTSHLWQAAGGVGLPLYLLWHYCGQLVHTGGGEERQLSSLRVCISDTLALLAALIARSMDMRDAMLQEHGFHVVALALGRLAPAIKQTVLDEALVDSCVQLVLALGEDACGGDGALAALQGLLLDFSLWGVTALSVRSHLLGSICDRLPNIGHNLHRAVGLQQLQDICLQYILHSDDKLSAAGADVAYRALTAVLAAARKTHQDKCERLLRRSAAAGPGNDAGSSAQSAQVSFVEAEMLVRGIDEAKNNVSTEVILRCLKHLQSECPDELEAVLESSRFNDTTAVYLLCKRQLSTEVRHMALHTLLWGVRKAHGLILDDILELCNCMFRRGGVEGPGQAAVPSPGPSAVAGGASRRGSVKAIRSAFVDARKGKELLEALKGKKVTLQRLWRTMCMLSECLRRALRDGAWDEHSSLSVDKSSTGGDLLTFDSFCLHSGNDDLTRPAAPPIEPGEDVSRWSPEMIAAIHDISGLLRHDGPLGQLDVWLILPVVAAVLPYLSTDRAEGLLASMGVVLKTSEPQVLAFCVLADNLWVKYFVDLSLAAPGGNRAAVASSDLALDAYAQILTYQLVHFGNSAWLSWKAFHAHLRSDASACVGTNEVSMLRKCAGFVLQKLMKHPGDLSDDALCCLSKIIVFVEEKRLCGNEPVIVGGGLSSHSLPGSGVDLLDFEDFMDTPSPPPAALTADEASVLRQICSFMSCLRAASQNLSLGRPTPFGFSEVRALQPCVRILLGCLPRVTLATADALCLELRSVVLHSADRWMFYDPEYYKLFIIDVFGGLQAAIRKPGLATDVSERYRTAVLTIAHIFLELRRVSLEQSGYISPHVMPTLDAVGITEGYYDSEVVLSLLHKYEETARDSIVSAAPAGREEFGEDDYDMMGSPPPKSMTPQRSPAGALPEEVISFEAMGDPFAPSPPPGDTLDLLETTLASSTSAVSDTVAEPMIDPSPSPGTVDGDSADRPILEGSKDSTGRSAVSDQELYFRDWLQRRQGILSERLDSSRTRLDHQRLAVSLGVEATQKCWRRLCRKVESESFLEDHWCSWKLGVSHEGYFPGRRRVILRPRFLEEGDSDKAYKQSRPYVCGEEYIGDLVDSDHEDGHTETHEEGGTLTPPVHSSMKRAASFSSSADFGLDGTDGMRTLLEMAKSGIIADPVAAVPVADDGDFNRTAEAEAMAGSERGMKGSPVDGEPPGGLLVGFGGGKAGSAAAATSDQSWGLVGADEDEIGGYGVVGYEPAGDDKPKDIADQPTVQVRREDTAISSSIDNEVARDLQFDILQLETDLRQGRLVNTGASIPGTRRVSAAQGSSVICEAPVTLITASGNYIGLMSFTNSEIYFISSDLGGEGNEHLLDAAAVTLMPGRRIRRRKWLIERISGVYLRTYRLRESALEVFFRRGKHRNFFVDFGSVQQDLKQRNVFAKALMNAAPAAAMKQWPHSTFYRLLHEHGMQERWMNGHVSNFDYIMFLNTMSGRSYNDLCQYPVFPWVLSQYDQDVIDLGDPANYRDLSKPVGALNPTRLRDFVERYKSFGDSEIPPFMYGSHYSTMVGVVLHYLVRLQPFASLHQEIQNGRFDVPDRLFSSIPRTWDHNYNMLSEVKELTPEFYTLPEFLKNVNNFDLGRVQDGSAVGDVELPPWASSAEEFIRIQREALEGEYVSSHLHLWIDLIFGCKQRGQAAVDAHNVFYYLTYSGTVDREKLDDVTKKCVDLQIAHFGQCPNQLFGGPHPQKRVRSPPVPRPLRKCFRARTVFGSVGSSGLQVAGGAKSPATPPGLTAPTCIEEALVANSCASVIPGPPTSAVISIKIAGKKLTCVRDNGIVDVYKYSFTDSAKAALVQYAKMHNAGPAGRRGSAVRNGPQGGDEVASLAPARVEPALLEHPDIISFDAFDNSESVGHMPSPGEVAHEEVIPVYDRESERAFSGWATHDHVVVTAESVIGDSVTVPRVPVAHIRPGGGIAARGSTESMDRRVHDTHLTHFLRLDSLVLTAGRSDGVVCVRELDTASGAQVSGGDFKGHRFQVCFLSSDSIPNGNSSLVASCDVAGQVLVWTVSVSSHQGYNRHIVSRRPQRVFRCFPGQNCCDISWQMGVVVAGSRHCISVFSIERNERFRIIDVRHFVLKHLFAEEADIPGNPLGILLAGVAAQAASADLNTVNGVSNSGRFSRDRLWEDDHGCRVVNIACCDYGGAVAYVEVDCTRLPSACQFPDPAALPASFTASQQLYLLMAYSVDGSCTGISLISSRLTCLDCPGRGGVVTIGTEDGSVIFMHSMSLEVLHALKPNEKCIRLSSTGEVLTARSDSRAQRGGRKAPAVTTTSELQSSIPPSPIVVIKVGPKLDRPTFAAVSCASGQLYLIPFSDFIRYEKLHATTAFSQIVNAPMQAVKGTIQSAQNFTILAGDAAGSLAQNAKGIAGDAIGEAQDFLKKMNKTKIFKGVGSFFGGSGNAAEKKE